MKSAEEEPGHGSPGLAGRIAGAFIGSKLTPLLILASVLLGAAAVWLLPREEEPQIKVPMIDVLVSMPGFSAKEVEERATRPMEKLLWEIAGVEYIYSTSRPGESLVVVRFKVGEEIERSLVKLNQKLQSNFDRIPPGVSFPLIKPKSIDDVPILALTFHSDRYDHLTLRRLVTQVNTGLLESLLSQRYVPVIAPVGFVQGRTLPLDADQVAAHIAGALKAAKLVYLAGASGLSRDEELAHQLTSTELQGMLAVGTLSSSLAGKAQGALHALSHGVARVHLIDARIPHTLIAELFTDEGVGTLVTHG